MPEINLPELISVLPCRIPLTSGDAARVVQVIVMEIVMLAVMFGLMDVPSEIPEVTPHCPGIQMGLPRAETILLPGPVFGLPASRTAY